MTFPVLYVAVRNDMNSMNSGKAEAHSGHAANAFVEAAIVGPLLTKGQKPDALAMEWRQATNQGFGTQINLDANFKQIQTIVEVAKVLGFMAELVVDPSYPYEVSNEIAALIPEEIDSVDKDGNKIPRIYKGDTVVLFRNEVTAAYIFGDKENPLLEAVVGRFRLKP